MFFERRKSRWQRLSWPERLLTMLLAAGISVVLALAVWLVPDPRGFGTHEQLGLPPCFFFTATGRPCPHCGLTTSFCWFVRGAWKDSCAVNPAGFLLAAVCACSLPWIVAVAYRGEWLGVREPRRLFFLSVTTWLVFSFVVWMFRH